MTTKNGWVSKVKKLKPKSYKRFTILCVAIGMEFNAQKSTSCFHWLREKVEQRLAKLFPFRTFNILEGFNYIGFVLNPNSYGMD